MISFLFKLQKTLLIWSKIKNYKAAKALASFHGNNYYIIKTHSVYCENNQIISPKTGVKIPITTLPFFRNDLKLAFSFFEKFVVDFTHKKYLKVIHPQTAIQVKAYNFDTIFAIYEIFEEDFYDIRSSNDIIVIDIGMNVGVASLYFAAKKNVKKVYGFEPFEGTFKIAIENFELNPSLKDKIIAENVGVGDLDKELQVPAINDGFLGASTTDFFLNANAVKNVNKFTTIKIINIIDLLANVLKNHPKENILFKLDCEGAEYEIIEALAAQNMLNKAHFYVIEWHLKGKEILLKPLQKSGFQTIAPNRKDARFDLGFIYAYQ